MTQTLTCKYCVPLCGSRAYNDRRRADGRMAALTVQQRDYHAEYNRQRVVTHGSLRQRYPETMRVHDLRRRALKVGAECEYVQPAEVYVRDGWICGLCYAPVDPLTTYPDPQSASLDHVVPLSKGGPHTYANTQLAHLSCNVAKGNRVPTMED